MELVNDHEKYIQEYARKSINNLYAAYPNDLRKDYIRGALEALAEQIGELEIAAGDEYFGEFFAYRLGRELAKRQLDDFVQGVLNPHACGQKLIPDCEEICTENQAGLDDITLEAFRTGYSQYMHDAPDIE